MKKEKCVGCLLDDLVLRKDEFRKFYAIEFIPTILENKKTILKKMKILDNKYTRFYPNL